jgi:hypothetical protein
MTNGEDAGSIIFVEGSIGILWLKEVADGL